MDQRQAHYQAGLLLRDSLVDLNTAEQILSNDRRLATGVMGADALGLGLGGGLGGWGGAFDGNVAGDAVTLFADMKEQQMAQQADAAVQAAAGRIFQARQIAPDLPRIDLAVVESLKSGIYLDIISGALSELFIRQKLQKGLNNIQIMKQQVFNATEWLANAYGLPHADVMQPGWGAGGYAQQSYGGGMMGGGLGGGMMGGGLGGGMMGGGMMGPGMMGGGMMGPGMMGGGMGMGQADGCSIM